MQIGGTGAADPAETADDDVIGQPGDLASHSASLQMATQVSLDQCLEQHAERVQRGADTGEDEHDREDLAARSEWMYLAETDGRDGGDRLVQGLEQAEAEDQVADRAHEQHQREREQGEPDPPHGFHAAIVSPPRAPGATRRYCASPVSIRSASWKSALVTPPLKWVLSERVTVSHRISMSGW